MGTNLIDAMDIFSDKKVLIIGDLYLDEYIWGDMAEISKEGPIPIIHIKTRTFSPGAAGNTACGVRALGAVTYVAGVVGNDTNAKIMLEEFKSRGINTHGVVVDKSVPTNTYTKITAGGFHSPRQEVLRVDTERPEYIEREIEDKIITYVKEIVPEMDAIIIVDQVAGVATHRLLKEVVQIAKTSSPHPTPVIGDSREQARELKGFDLILPNDSEASLATGIRITDEESLIEAGFRLLREGRNHNVIITQGKDGMSVFEEDGSVTHLPTFAQEVFDVTGAGDTATATTTLGLLSGLDVIDAARLANYAAGIVVSKMGTATVSREEIRKAIERQEAISSLDKIRTLPELTSRIESLKMMGKKIVWTNGCFDILHAGHVTYLQKAKELGDVLIVGLDSDSSVRALKGPGRPVVSEGQRAIVLAALSCVDYIIVYPEPEPTHIIEALKPDVYVKGGDYTINTLNSNETRVVESYGGEITILPEVDGESTTKIIDRILSEENQTVLNVN